MIRLKQVMIIVVLLGLVVGRGSAEVPRIIFDTDRTAAEEVNFLVQSCKRHQADSTQKNCE